MINMKKRIITLLTIATLTLTSCTSKRNNIIISGHFYGLSLENKEISCAFFIEQISEYTFLNANGKNVIRDAINEKCYSLEFYVNLSENDVKQVDFLNLRDAYNNASGTPISYVDDNNYWLTPFTSENNETLPVSRCYYSVNINIGDFKLSAYLHFMDD